MEFTPKTLPWVWGSIYKKKVVQDPGPNPHTAAAIRKEMLPPPPPQKEGYLGRGVRGSKSENSSGDHFLSQNDDFTRLSRLGGMIVRRMSGALPLY